MPAPQVAGDGDEEHGDGEDDPGVEDSEGREPTGVSEDTEDNVDQDLAEIPDDGADIPEPEAEVDDAPADTETADPFEGDDDIEVDLADTSVGEETSSDGPFSGDDDVTTPTSEEAGSSDVSASDIQQGMEALGDDSQLDEAINEGFARLAVVGLDDGEEKDSLEMEFAEVFEMFRLGHFGSEAVQEYVLTGPEEDVDPLWAFTVSLAMSTALVVYMRPDRTEIVESAKDSLSRFTGGIPDVR